MDSHKWKKVKSILAEAIELPAAARAEYLNRVCGTDDELRREVESLLNFKNPKTGVPEKPAFDSASAAVDEKPIVGKQIDRYKIVGELGAGNTGAVFLAKRGDGAFEQTVALKLIKHRTDSAAILRRFINERQILAALEHPNIARLIDGGTTAGGAPYFVMEYIEGETITDYAAQAKLDLGARLKLFREICAAVSFAHRNLVIHGNLKPSNVLIAKDGTPKILDFGIAKLLKDEAASETAEQNFAFTPEYASPEQMRGEKLTTATDVYSLGVILYELLSDHRPYRTDEENISEIMRAVGESEPERPSSAVRRLASISADPTAKDGRQTADDGRRMKFLKGDLDNICLKALRKEPERRYSSVEQFSEDIRRHQTGLPVLARPVTFGYRAEKFFERNRIAAAAGFLVLLALVGGLVAASYRANVAETERARAERRFGEVRRLANSLITEFPHEADKSATKAKELLVSRSLEYLDSLAAEAGDDANLQRELATAYQKIGDVQGNDFFVNLGDTVGALKSYEKSLQLRQALFQMNPAHPEIKAELSHSHERLGDVRRTMNESQAAMEHYRQSLALREELAANNPDSNDHSHWLATILWKTGDLLGNGGFSNPGDAESALEHYRRAIEIRESLVAEEPENSEYRLALASNYTSNADVLRASGKSAEAEQNYRNALRIIGEIAATNAGAKNEISRAHRRQSAAVYQKTAAAYVQSKNCRTALDLYRKSFEIWDAMRREGTLNQAEEKNLSEISGEIARCSQSAAGN